MAQYTLPRVQTNTHSPGLCSPTLVSRVEKKASRARGTETTEGGVIGRTWGFQRFSQTVGWLKLEW
jgi:hypothetical protein